MASILEVSAPFDGATIGQVPTSGAEEVERALATAHALYRNRRQWLPKQQRIAILRRAAAIVTERREALARQAAHEGGKPFKDSLVEVDRGIDGIHSCVDVLRTEGGHVIPMDLNGTSAGRVAFTQYEPIGVVVGVTAFNHPFNLVVHQVAPAVAVGAPVIIKPAAATPLSCKAVVDIFHEAGLPARLGPDGAAARPRTRDAHGRGSSRGLLHLHRLGGGRLVAARQARSRRTLRARARRRRADRRRARRRPRHGAAAHRPRVVLARGSGLRRRAARFLRPQHRRRRRRRAWPGSANAW